MPLRDINEEKTPSEGVGKTKSTEGIPLLPPAVLCLVASSSSQSGSASIADRPLMERVAAASQLWSSGQTQAMWAHCGMFDIDSDCQNKVLLPPFFLIF